MALLTVSQDLGVFGWGDDSQIFRDILSLPIMMPIVQGLVGPGFRMDHSPFCIRMQRGSEGDCSNASHGKKARAQRSGLARSGARLCGRSAWF